MDYSCFGSRWCYCWNYSGLVLHWFSKPLSLLQLQTRSSQAGRAMIICVSLFKTRYINNNYECSYFMCPGEWNFKISVVDSGMWVCLKSNCYGRVTVILCVMFLVWNCQKLMFLDQGNQQMLLDLEWIFPNGKLLVEQQTKHFLLVCIKSILSSV